MAKKKGSKSDFIRGLPADMPQAEIIAKGKEAGLNISKALIYIVRTGWKAKKKRSTKSKASRSVAAAPKASAAKAAPAKVAHPAKMSASDFIRAQPATMKARKVAEEGAKHGHSFKPEYVYAIRRKQPKRAAAKANGPAPKAKAATAPAATSNKVIHPSSKEAMRSLMIEIGVNNFQALATVVLRELKGSGN